MVSDGLTQYSVYSSLLCTGHPSDFLDAKQQLDTSAYVI